MPYTYVHLTQDTGEVFYVGKGRGNRANDTKSRNKFWHSKVKKHGGFVARIVAEWETDQQAFEHEVRLQRHFEAQGLKLTNVAPCGYGHTSETAKKLNEERVKSGVHQFLGGEMVRERVRSGRHHWLDGGDVVRERNIRRSKNGENPFAGKRGSDLQKRLVSEGRNASQIKVGCIKCKRVLSVTNFHQYHGEKCGIKQPHTVSKVECPHCGKIGGANNMPRYHFENCKLKGTSNG